MGRGCRRRSPAAPMIASAASEIRPASNTAEKYSALPCPKGCSSSAGSWAQRSIQRAKSAPARLTDDSMASDRKPTEPVSPQAVTLIAMVARAAPTESLIACWGARILMAGRVPHPA